MSAEIIVCTATDFEATLIRPHLPVLVTGVGAVSAASALTRFLEREGARIIVSCGIAGSYPDTGIELATAVWAASECYADLGAASPEGFLDMRALGFPVVAGPPAFYNEFPVAIRPPGPAAAFATVNTCTGDDATARAIRARTGAAVETMEGAAIAHVAALYGIPCAEVRGISNQAGIRNRAAWRVKDAAAAAQEALLSAWRAGEFSVTKLDKVLS